MASTAENLQHPYGHDLTQGFDRASMRGLPIYSVSADSTPPLCLATRRRFHKNMSDGAWLQIHCVPLGPESSPGQAACPGES